MRQAEASATNPPVMHAVRALSLDWYGTLVQGGTDRLVALLRERVNAHRPDVAFADILHRREALIASLETRSFLAFEARDQWILGTLYSEFGLPGDPVDDAAALHRAHLSVTAYPEAADFLARVVAAGIPTVIVSNADEDMIRAGLAQTGLAADGVVTSETAKAYKPAPAMFEAAVKSLGVPASAIVHVGDSFVADVVGAKRVGMRAAWVKRTGLPAPAGAEVSADFECGDLLELAGLLGL